MSDYLPFEIQLNIMKRLPVKSLLQFWTVSKQWKFTIDSSYFLREYGFRQCDTYSFNLSYEQGHEGFMCSLDQQMSCTPLNTNLQLSSLKSIATSERVWCFWHASRRSAVLWNPCIRKDFVIVVPYTTMMMNRPILRKCILGFGVRPDTLDPTLLNISMPWAGRGPWHVLVYTLSSDNWNSLEDYRLPSMSIRIKRSWGQAVVGSFIFWGGSESCYRDDGSSYKIYILVSFDLINHQFQVVDMPYDLRNILQNTLLHITQLGNSLVISGNVILGEIQHIHAWLLEVDGNFVTSWRLLFIIPSPNIANLIGFTKDDKPILQVGSTNQMASSLQLYESISREFHNLGIEADCGSFFIGSYKESLIFLMEKIFRR